jgi:hypothetical protein
MRKELRTLKSMRKVGALLVAVLVTGSLYAYAPRQLTLEEKVAASTIVIIGTVESDNLVSDTDNSGRRMATITVETWLKGKEPVKVKLAHGTGETWLKGKEPIKVKLAHGTDMAEFEPDCCVAGGRYLLFLLDEGDGTYKTAAGMDGAITISTTSH